MGRTCGEPNEIELTAIGVELNGSRGVRVHQRACKVVHPGLQGRTHDVQ